ncbi:MAG: hypothetical protein WBC93_11945 [Sulfitobacter sp.]
MSFGFYIVPLIWACFGIWLGSRGQYLRYALVLVAGTVAFLAYVRLALGAGLTEATTLTALAAFVLFGLASFGLGWLFRRDRGKSDR